MTLSSKTKSVVTEPVQQADADGGCDLQAATLPQTVHAVRVDDDLVFLDTDRDAYVCLPDGASAVRLSPNGACLLSADQGLLAELRRAGLINPADLAEASPRPRSAPPTASALRDTYPLPRWGDVFDAALACLDVLRNYRGRSFAQLLADTARNRPTTICDPDRRRRLVERFHRWSPYAPVSGKCLLRAFMLLRFLRRHGCDAEWVFGVSTWPFRAHCWLQAGELALDDHPDRLAPYTPILVL